MDTPIRLFVGCSANEEDAESQAVLEYTVRKYASQPVELTWMKLTRDHESPWFSAPEQGLGWNTGDWVTPFSGFRWSIPAVCDYEGRGIYSDSDVIFMDDIAKLWNTEMEPGKVVVAKGAAASWRYCVSLWDCAAAKKELPPFNLLVANRSSHQNLMMKFANHPSLVQAFTENWNCLDGEDYEDLHDPEIKAIHYTSMQHQPHLAHAVPRLAADGRKHWFEGVIEPHWRDDLVKLFDKLLIEAEENGYPVERYLGGELYGPYTKRPALNSNPHISRIVA